jgi:ASC-1-like (ASCH) protein
MKEIHCQEPWFSKIKNGFKKVEGRKFSSKYASLTPGELLKFYCGQDSFVTEVIKVVKYPSLEEYLATEGFEKALPGAQSFQEAVNIYLEFNNRDALEKAGGFLAIHIKIR